MSKLAKALDRARQERFSSTGPWTAQTELQESLADETARDDFSDYDRSGHESAQSFSAKPVYSMTRVLNPAQDFPENKRTLRYVTDPEFLDSFHYLCTQVLQKSRPRGWNTIMVTSARPGEGKTLTAVNLALNIAREMNQTSLLVGANFRNPRTCGFFGLDENRPGLSDHLVDQTPLPELLFSPGTEKMVILPTGRKANQDFNVLSSPRMQALTSELKSRYSDRYIIYDCPHLLDMPDALVFSSHVDAVLLVVEAGRTTGQDIKRALKILTDQEVNILGLALNKYEN